jgi:alkylated DNA repair dioxygenase AlkB
VDTEKAMQRNEKQLKLLDVPLTLPTGLVYRPDFLTPAEEEILIVNLQNQPLEHAVYKEEYESKRRHIGFGWSYDFEKKRLIPGPPLPRFLTPLQIKIAKWLGVPKECVVEALVNEYTEGSAIGWHVDGEAFDKIVGVSLAGWARMRFRPLKSRGSKKLTKDIVALELEPRSAYLMQSDVRWRWQHSVARVSALRYSITFRTLPANRG